MKTILIKIKNTSLVFLCIQAFIVAETFAAELFPSYHPLLKSGAFYGVLYAMSVVPYAIQIASIILMRATTGSDVSRAFDSLCSIMTAYKNPDVPVLVDEHDNDISYDKVKEEARNWGKDRDFCASMDAIDSALSDSIRIGLSNSFTYMLSLLINLFLIYAGFAPAWTLIVSSAFLVFLYASDFIMRHVLYKAEAVKNMCAYFRKELCRK